MPSQVTFALLQLKRIYNVKLHVFKSSGQRTYNSDIYHPKIAWYVEKSALANINPKSYHLTAFELVNPLHYIYFPRFEYRIFVGDLKFTLKSPAALCFVTSLILSQGRRLLNNNCCSVCGCCHDNNIALSTRHIEQFLLSHGEIS